MLKYMLMMFFYFLKIIFDISTSKQFKTYKPYQILTKKNFEFYENAVSTAFPNASNHCLDSREAVGFQDGEGRLVLILFTCQA